MGLNPRTLLLLASVLFMLAGPSLITFSDLEWRGLIGWGLMLIGLVLLVIQAPMRTRSRSGRKISGSELQAHS